MCTYILCVCFDYKVGSSLLPCVLWALFERYVLIHSPSIHVVNGGGSPVMHCVHIQNLSLKCQDISKVFVH